MSLLFIHLKTSLLEHKTCKVNLKCFITSRHFTSMFRVFAKNCRRHKFLLTSREASSETVTVLSKETPPSDPSHFPESLFKLFDDWLWWIKFHSPWSTAAVLVNETWKLFPSRSVFSSAMTESSSFSFLMFFSGHNFSGFFHVSLQAACHHKLIHFDTFGIVFCCRAGLPRAPWQI